MAGLGESARPGTEQGVAPMVTPSFSSSSVQRPGPKYTGAPKLRPTTEMPTLAAAAGCASTTREMVSVTASMVPICVICGGS